MSPILVLQVNFAGALEFDKQRMYFFASLYDSHVLFITIEGEMGLLVAWGDDANFVVSVGGFHPQFNPPPLPFPAPAAHLSRHHQRVLRAHPRCEGYFAVTTNTVQFGIAIRLLFRFRRLQRRGHSRLRRADPVFAVPFHRVVSTSFSVNVFGVGCLRHRH